VFFFFGFLLGLIFRLNVAVPLMAMLKGFGFVLGTFVICAIASLVWTALIQARWTWTDFLRRADFRGTRKVHARRRNRRDHDRLRVASPDPRSDTTPGATCKLARRFVRVGDRDIAAQLLRSL
jgi:hypothetical protein